MENAGRRAVPSCFPSDVPSLGEKTLETNHCHGGQRERGANHTGSEWENNHIEPPGEIKADFAEAVVLQLRTGDKGESPDKGHHILGLQNRAQGDWARMHLTS